MNKTLSKKQNDNVNFVLLNKTVQFVEDVTYWLVAPVLFTGALAALSAIQMS
ncbi:hypothetical protein [Zooshikella harenae]|uniref:Uncharacterized protein n=1 Tax=Zooshikella harenae TaxID=2827238 RepID=A0ABS5ZDN3_9GAMM|nr:hypothetical protein [Zooshikella harenae]MBU2711057.1 hypothetical protein [Zooshikella harenae]